MPVLHKHQNSNGHYIIAQHKGTPVVYQLRESGVQKLRSICLGDKSKFPEWILENLKVDAEVYTINPSNIIKKEDVNARKLAFADEVRNDGGFPKCDYCTSFKGLLFVVRQEAEKGIVGEIVCNTCFAKNQFPQETGTTLCAKNGPLQDCF
jgi:hypothetical protein